MRTIRTPKKREQFLTTLRESGGNVSRSCSEARLSRVAAYAWRADDSNFARDWDEALEFAIEALEEEVRRRAFKGTDEPVYYQGEEVGAVRKYSDTLAIFLLKAHRPERYREHVKTEISGPNGQPLISPLPEEISTALRLGYQAIAQNGNSTG
jgi:hypothetical protein